MTEEFRVLRFVSFKNKANELLMHSWYFLDSYREFNKPSKEKEYIDYYHLGEDAGNVFRLREWFYDHFDWRF